MRNRKHRSGSTFIRTVLCILMLLLPLLLLMITLTIYHPSMDNIDEGINLTTSQHEQQMGVQIDTNLIFTSVIDRKHTHI